MPESEQEKLEDLVDALCFGERMLPGMDDAFQQLLARINLVCVASPELDYPAFDEAGLRRFFRFALAGRDEPEQTDAMEALREFVGPVRMGWLDQIVPRNWMLDGGEAVELRYAKETNPAEGTAFSPVGAVKLEALSGVDDHPFVCEGRVAVKLRLLNSHGKFLEETLDCSTYSANRMSRSSR